MKETLLAKLRKRFNALQRDNAQYIARLSNPQHEMSAGLDTDTLHRLLSKERAIREIWPLILSEISNLEKAEAKRLRHSPD